MEIVTWRDWLDQKAVEALTKLGQVPSEQFQFKGWAIDGTDVAQAIVEECNKNDCTAYAEGGKIEIINPPKWAGVYEIGVDWTPTFFADTIEE